MPHPHTPLKPYPSNHTLTPYTLATLQHPDTYASLLQQARAVHDELQRDAKVAEDELQVLVQEKDRAEADKVRGMGMGDIVAIFFPCVCFEIPFFVS